MSFKLNDQSNKTYCPLAWTHSFINQDGSHQVCCTSEEFDNYIRDDEGNKLYITDNLSPKEILNTNFMKKLRLEMLEGKWPDMCQRCKLTEDMGGVSRRNIEVKNYKKHNQNFLDKTDSVGTISNNIKSADYRLGNLCNLQCRMCNPRSTTLWIKEWNEVKRKEEHFDEETMESYKNYKWIDSLDLVKDFEEKAPFLEHIHFAGGEPLVVPQMKTILQKCIESGNAKNIILTYNTNGTILPKSVIELWKNFKGVKLLMSIDAFGELNEYIRHPSKWNQIDKNLQDIDKNYKEYNITECIISTTVQILNIMKLDELYEYLSKFEFIVNVPNLINLHVPSYFRSSVLPEKYKILTTAKLLSLQNKYGKNLPPHYAYLKQNISQAINFMNTPEENPMREFYDFLEFQSNFDKKRNISVYNFYPTFENYKLYSSEESGT